MNVFAIFITCLHGLGMEEKRRVTLQPSAVGVGVEVGGRGAPLQPLGQLQPREVCAAPSSSWLSSTPYPIKEREIKREK